MEGRFRSLPTHGKGKKGEKEREARAITPGGGKESPADLSVSEGPILGGGRRVCFPLMKEERREGWPWLAHEGEGGRCICCPEGTGRGAEKAALYASGRGKKKTPHASSIKRRGQSNSVWGGEMASRHVPQRGKK